MQYVLPLALDSTSLNKHNSILLIGAQTIVAEWIGHSTQEIEGLNSQYDRLKSYRKPGNPSSRGRHSTVDLHIEIAICKNEKNIFSF